MSVVLPGPSVSVVRQQTGNTTEFEALGPMGAGSWLRRVRVFWSMDGIGTLYMAFGLSSSPVGSDAALRASQSLVGRGPRGTFGVPHHSIIAEAKDFGWWDFPGGVTLKSGSNYIIMGMRVSTEVTARVMIIGETMQIVKEVDAAGVVS